MAEREVRGGLSPRLRLASNGHCEFGALFQVLQPRKVSSGIELSDPGGGSFRSSGLKKMIKIKKLGQRLNGRDYLKDTDSLYRQRGAPQVILEPKIPGMSWEKYLGWWRSKFGKEADSAELSSFHKIKHISSLSGLYLLGTICSLSIFFKNTNSYLLCSLGVLLFLGVFGLYIYFYKVYGRFKEEGKKLKDAGFAG